MIRTAVYTGTKNIYHDMIVSAKSLLYYNNADKVILMTEDDTITESVPPCISIMNVSNQPYFHHTGPNFRSKWSYMVLMRVALPKIFPDLPRVIHLDHDTICHKHAPLLWSADLSNYFYAAVAEEQIKNRTTPYFNFGVVVHNLQKLRDDGADDTIILTLNTVYMEYCEQDAVNSVCKRHILALPPSYNVMWFNTAHVNDEDIVIKHYAARKKPLKAYSDYQFFDAMSWDSVLSHKEEVMRNETL